MSLKNILIFFSIALNPLWCFGETAKIDCIPDAQGRAELLEIRPKFYSIKGSLGKFDPCHASVKFRVPEGKTRPPLMISVHGGGGINDVINSDQAFYDKGMATLIFDAYTMQGLPSKPSLFYGRSMTNESRQRMIFATALHAYKWAITRSDIDTNRIYIFGISNGAAVVANLAAVVDPSHVKGIISEGVTPIGMGLPNEIKVPMLLAFGRLDDFGNTNPTGRRWDLSGPCRFNRKIDTAPPGSTDTCSFSVGGGDIPTPLDWVKTVNKNNVELRVEYFEDMAHSAFFGPLRIRRATWANGVTAGASLGATTEAREKFMHSMLRFIDEHQ